MQGHACSDKAVRDNTTTATTRKLLIICALLSLQVLPSFPLRFMRSNQVLAEAAVCSQNTHANKPFFRLNLCLSVLYQDRKVLPERCCMSHNVAHLSSQNPHRPADCPALSSNHSQSRETSLIDEWPSYSVLSEEPFNYNFIQFSHSPHLPSQVPQGLCVILVEVELFLKVIVKRSSEEALDMLGT